MIDEVRETWTNQIDFFLSALGYAVGFGAIWRFPYLTYVNGGGAFLIPYLLMFVIIGLPVFFIEMTLGQYSSSGPVRVYQNICPLLGGTGIGMVLNSFIIMLYYNMILAWTLYYLYTICANITRVITAKMRSQSAAHIHLLDWSTCNPEWSSPECVDLRLLDSCRQFHRSHLNATSTTGFSQEELLITQKCSNISFAAVTTTMNPLISTTINSLINATINATITKPPKRISPSEDFFYRNMLEMGTSINSWSWPVPQMFNTLFFAWVIAFVCLVRGLKMSGKIVWVTSTFPYLILVILLIRGAFLPGAGEGVRYFIQPNLRYLGSYTAWVQAASMILFLLSVGGGGLSTYASYNQFHNNIYRDSLLIPVLDVLASFLGGFCVFAYVGFIAQMLDVAVPDAVQQGTAVLFISLPEATTQMPASVIWALCLCLMMLMLGMDTQFAFVETCNTALLDEWPRLRKHRSMVLFLLCTFGMIFGLVLTLRSGLFWLNLIDYYVGGWPLIFFTLCENCVILIYGPNRLSDNLESMTGKRFGYVFKAMWWFFTPIILLVLLVLSCISQAPLKDDNDVVYPLWSQGVGWAICIANVSVVPLYALYAIFTKHRDKGLWQRLKILARPTDGWDELDARAKKLHVRNAAANGGGDAIRLAEGESEPPSGDRGGGQGPGDYALKLEHIDGNVCGAMAAMSSHSLAATSGYGGSSVDVMPAGSVNRGRAGAMMDDDVHLQHRRHSAIVVGNGDSGGVSEYYANIGGSESAIDAGGSSKASHPRITSADVHSTQSVSK